MNEHIAKIKASVVGIVAVVNGLVVGKFGVLAPLLYFVVLMMVMDLVTRIYSAGVNPQDQIESKKAWLGLYRKFGLCLLIVFCLVLDAGVYQIAATMGIHVVTKVVFTSLILAWIFVREAISIIENLEHAGIELPTFIAKAMKLGEVKVEDIGASIIKGEPIVLEKEEGEEE